MRTRSRESLSGSFAPVLTAPILARINELNRDYVELLISRGSYGPGAPLPVAVMEGLAALTAAARHALAACPFPLYSLGIERVDFWRAATALAQAAALDRYRGREALSPEGGFGIAALFCAWHIASAQRMAARVFYAMPDFAIDELARMKLRDLQYLACEERTLPPPRWPTNSCFWPDLVRFAAAGDVQRLNTTQLLGSQLSAADLRNNMAVRSTFRPAVRPPVGPGLASSPPAASTKL